MYVGPRLGFDVPVSRPAPTVQLAEHKQSGSGVTGGLWFGMKVSDRLSLEIAPGTGSQQFTSDLAGPYIDNGVDVELRSYQKASLSFLDLPLHLRFAFIRSSAAVVPYVSVGGALQRVGGRSWQVDGVSRIAGVEWPFFDERPQASTAESWSTALIVAGGVEYALSRTWKVRGEASLIARPRPFTSGASTVLIGYDAFDNLMYYDFATAFPAASIGLTAGIVGYF